MKADLPKYIPPFEKLSKNYQICSKEDKCVVSLLKSARCVSVNLSGSRRGKAFRQTTTNEFRRLVARKNMRNE